MARDTESAERTTDTRSENSGADADPSDFDRELLSDLFVNVVPVAIIAVFVLMFGLLSPANGSGDPLLLFHGGLIGGIVLVSVVAGWLISGEDGPLEGSAANDYDGELDEE